MSLGRQSPPAWGGHTSLVLTGAPSWRPPACQCPSPSLNWQLPLSKWEKIVLPSAGGYSSVSRQGKCGAGSRYTVYDARYPCCELDFCNKAHSHSQKSPRSPPFREDALCRGKAAPSSDQHQFLRSISLPGSQGKMTGKWCISSHLEFGGTWRKHWLRLS